LASKPEMSIQERINKEFLSMPLRPDTLTFYSVRSSILASVKTQTALFYGTVLDVGCGFMPYRNLVESVPAVDGYVGMDLRQPTYYGEIEPDLKWDGERIPADDERFECVMATEFLEHYAEPERVLREIFRVMKPNGMFFATVPFIWNLHELPYDEYRYTPYSLDRHLRNAGFTNIEINPIGGWNMAFAQMIGLWLGFSPIHRLIRPVLKVLFFPLYAYLVKTDKTPAGFDGTERSMFNGLCVTARR
jgi:SAM-dependent methyltransferase